MAFSGAGAGAGAGTNPFFVTPVTPAAAIAGTGPEGDAALSVLVVGASGDLAKKKTYPSLFELFTMWLIPRNITIVGYARSAKSDEEFRAHLRDYLRPKGSEAEIDTFLARCYYRQGQYNSSENFAVVAEELEKLEDVASGGSGKANRLFYYAIPPTVFALVSGPIKEAALTTRGWNRVVIEKPFGQDLESSLLLSKQIGRNFTEKQIYRIDHYLGKDMVQNLMVLRFGNTVFEPLWNRNYISNVQIVFKEPFGTEGRGGYFDTFGIIRDVMQNHLMQVLTLVAMEAPVSLEAEDIRDEKVRVLKCIPPIKLEETVLGQYTANPETGKPGYHDDEGVPLDSVTPTFATSMVHINNPRWTGVPFILKCGKALNGRKAEIRVQFKPKPNRLFAHQSVHSNELIIRIQPSQAIYMKVMSKMPGMQNDIVETELDLSYSNRYPGRKPPEAYARLVHDVIRGDKAHFVRVDELNQAWRIFTPFLHEMEAKRIQPLVYAYGSRGPPESDALMYKAGYIYGPEYTEMYKRTLALPDGQDHPALTSLEESFNMSTPQLRGLLNSFVDEMRRGLCGDDSSIKMIPSYVTKLPLGDETGEVWAMDMGGSNCRVVSYKLMGDGTIGDSHETKKPIPDDVKTAGASGLFDWLAGCLEDAGVPDGAKLGFTFSFPVDQTAINRGTLIHWTKGFTSRGVPGQDIMTLLAAALERRGKHLELSALVNDTVGTLIAKRYQDPRCTIGVILGTGTNACYVEQAKFVPKWKDSSEGIVVINTEWGGFGSGSGKRRILPLTTVDQLLGTETPRPTAQRFEKMISGEFLGELTRVALSKLHTERALWTGDHAPGSASALQTPWKFKSEFVSRIVADESKELDDVVTILREECKLPEVNPSDVKVVKRVAVMVARRAARLAAMAIAAVTSQMGPGPDHLAGIDGSVFLKFPHFKEWMEEALKELACNTVLESSEDGSGAGAALIALKA